MRSLVSLIGGILVVVCTLFVSWISIDEVAGPNIFRFFGREVIAGDLALVNRSAPVLTLVGGALIIIISLAAFVMGMADVRKRGSYLMLSIGIRLASLLVIGGAAWFMADVNNLKDELELEYFSLDEARVMIEEGVLISLGGAILAFIAGINTPFPVWNMLFRRRYDEDSTDKGRRAMPVQRREEYYTSDETVDGIAFRKGYSNKLKAAADVLPKGTPEEHFARAVRYEAEGKYNDAIAEYDAAIAGDPNFPSAHSNRGSLHLILGQRVKALYDFEKVIELSDDPDLVQMATDRVDELNEQASENTTE